MYVLAVREIGGWEGDEGKGREAADRAEVELARLSYRKLPLGKFYFVQYLQV